MPAGTLASILRKEITVRGVWGFDPWALPRNDCALALDAIRSGDIQVDPLITHRFPLDHINEAFEMMRSGREYYCKALITP